MAGASDDETGSIAARGSGSVRGPGGHTLRRSVTVSDTKPVRRRPTLGVGPESSLFAQPPRRSSNFSEISQEARDTLNPSLQTQEAARGRPTWDVLPLAFAFLPAIGGVLVQGGNAFVTDLMLLLLSAVFLHWSVTQPWEWYHSAQQVRLSAEFDMDDVAVESDSDAEDTPLPSNLDGVPEKTALPRRSFKTRTATSPAGSSPARETALRQLYRHEVLSLISCFVFPMLGACILHAIRGQLTRPSEGLVSNYNLTIFILGAEIRPLRHLIKLVQARTLHLQRIVHAHPYQTQETAEQPDDVEELIRRLDEIESRAESASTSAGQADAESKATKRADARREKDNLLREMRSQWQPELDKITNGLRRTHKQQMMLATQLDSRFRYFDQRLNDAVSLAAAASRNRKGRWSLVGSALNGLLAIPLLPFQVMAQVLSWPMGAVSSFFSGRRRSTPADKARRGRNGRVTTTSSRFGIESVPRPMNR